MKYLIYARKSTEDEDRQILSIGSQIDELKDIAKKRGLEIIGVMEESKSAKSPGRPVFNKMLAKFHEGKADGVLCWKLDRLARNPVDGGQISWLLQTSIIKSIQTFEKEYLPTDNVLLMNVEFGMANQFIRDLVINSKRGLKAKVEKGWFPVVAPLGYLNDIVEKTIIKDQERFTLVRKIWDLALTGAYTAAHISRVVHDDWKLTTVKRKKKGGNFVTRSTIYRMLNNPFYYGYFEYNGKLYKGKHDAMITEDEYWLVQRFLGEKGRPRPNKHYNFSFTGMIRCGECGSMITAEESLRVNKTNSDVRHYVYYRCTKKNKETKCSQHYIKIEDLEKYVDKYLTTIELDDEFIKWASNHMQEINQQETQNQNKIFGSLHEEKESVRKQLGTLTDMRMKELIDDKEYLELKEKLVTQKNKIAEKLGDADTSADNWLELMEQTFNFCHNARLWFKNGTPDDKKIILRTIGSNLLLKDKILQIEPKSVFCAVAEGLKNNNWGG